ncbi:MAG: hypothetical protein HYX28_10785 [Candidatus Koribacter versatilis]|uniref:Uncharacterized protein n=1 Tax=Candidatus Korobacter versatilis TaxID=658062 RepID=A0A932ABL7_9BACT|nr:hypothetical protein [Candidatus Koribacter versatilis]
MPKRDRSKWLVANTPLPPGFGGAGSIARAVDYLERELADLVEIYFDQANVFSALVGIFGAKALHSVTNWERNKNVDTAQQRFPDLCRRGCKWPPKPNECLESKGSKRPWAIQSHYDHPGWYIVWRYLVDPTEAIERKRPVIIWRVDVVFLAKSDWKYEASTASAAGGGRTHTFGVKNAAKTLKGHAVYQRTDVVIRDGKAVVANGH